MEPTYENLIHRCVLLPWEQRLAKVGCFASILLGLAAVALLWWVVSQASFRPSIWLILPIGFAAIGGAYTLIEWVVRRRATSNFVQLRYRLGQAPFAEYLAEIPSKMESSYEDVSERLYSDECPVHWARPITKIN